MLGLDLTFLRTISPKGVATLSNQDDCTMEANYYKSQLKHYIIPFDEKHANEVETWKIVNNERISSNGEASQPMEWSAI